MIFEGVNFNEAVIKSMSKDDFVRRHVDILWLDRDVPTRKKMLGQVHALINPVRPSKKKS